MTTAAREDVREINQELVLHNKWLSRQGGRRADLSFRDMSGMSICKIRLTGAKLIGTNLAKADLSGCDLMGAEMFGADLEAANLTGANLAGADFRGANLHRAILTDCILKGADFRTDTAASDALPQTPAHHGATIMTEARLERAILCEANLTGCDMSGADLDGADLAGADLSCCVMIGADMNGANLTGVKLGGTVLELSRLSASQQLALEVAAAAGGGVVEPELPLLSAAEAAAMMDEHARFINSGGKEGKRLDLASRKVEAADYSGRDLSGARIRRCVLKGADFSRCRFDMADLSYCDLSGCRLEQANLRGTNLRRAVLSRVLAAAAVFDALTLVDGRDWPANLEGALLHDADLTNTSFAKAILRHADIGGAILHGAGFHEVDMGSVKRSTPLEAPAGPKERRRQRRFRNPKLLVRTQAGNFPTRDWSFGGLSVLLTPEAVQQQAFKRGQQLTMMVGTKENPEGVAVSATVTFVSADLGRASFRYVKLEDELKALLNPLAPERYRTK
jgi:uncharacterized protein YjbI with pentapeptide repeats